ncbi:MAG TPA: TetR/AcrR family transcriptional regulator [Stenomitos sp.]
MGTSKLARTRDRLLEAAIDVMAREGIVGATTREIAQVAGVSEVTLFRHFRTKEQLLSAVAQHITALQSEALANTAEWTQDLHRDLTHYAWLYNNMLEKHEALVRMFIGEAQRHPEEALQVFQQAALPLRQKLAAYLQNHVERGSVRADVNLSATIDVFTGMLLAGMLRRRISPTCLGYSKEEYVVHCIRLFVSGIATPQYTPLPSVELPPQL